MKIVKKQEIYYTEEDRRITVDQKMINKYPDLFKEIRFRLNGGTNFYQSWFVNCEKGITLIPVSNKFLFDHFGIDNKAFSNKILGYYGGGDFPECNTKEDCLLLFNELLKIIINK